MSAVFNGASSLQAAYQPFTDDAATFLACYWVKPTAAGLVTHANFTAASSYYLILGQDASYHVTLQGRHTGTPVQLVTTAAMTASAWNLVTIWLDPASHAVTIWVNSGAGENLTLSTSDNIFAHVTTVWLGAFADTTGAMTGLLSRFCLFKGVAKPSDATVASVRGAVDPETAFGAAAIARWNLADSGADSAAGNHPLSAGAGTVTWSDDDPLAFFGAMAGTSGLSGTLTSARVLQGTLAGVNDLMGAVTKVPPSSEALALTIEDDGSHRVITAAVSVGGSPVTLADNGAQADDEKAFVALGWIDLAAGKLWQQIDGGTPTSTDLGGHPDPQNGSLMLGAGVGSDGAVISQDTTLAVLAAAAKSRPFTADDRDAMHAVAASVLAPVPLAATASIDAGTSTAIDVSGFADDPSGYGWTVTGISIPNPQCPLAITGDQEVTANPAIAQGDVAVELELTSSFPNISCVAHLPLTISVGQVTTYPNGYTHLMALPIADGAIEGAAALTNFIAVAKVSDPTLKSAANGGIVQSADGYDIRIEAAGTKIPHKILRNGATDGEWHLAYLRTSLQKADGVLPLAYLGKTGVASSEEDPATLFASEAFRFDLATGADLSGNEADMTLANITAADGPYGAAGLAGTSPSASLAATLVGAATHVTFSIWMDLADVAADSSLFSLGDTTSFDSAGLIAWADVVAAHSQNALTISAEAQSGAAHARFEGTAGVIKAGVWQMVSVDYLDGAVLGIQVDDQVLANSDPANAVMGSGLTSASPAKAFAGFTAAMRGKLAYWRADTRAGALPAAHKTTEWRNGRYLDAFHGSAGLESPGNTTRLIAMPVWASTTTGTTITLDPVAIAVGTGTLQLLSVGTPTDGTAAIAGNKISFTAPTTAQTVTFSYVLSDVTRSVTGQCVVVVTGAVPVTSSTKPWDNLYYGNPTMGVTVAPTQIKVGTGIKNFITYTVKRTGTITGLRTIIRASTVATNTGTNGAVSPGAYSKGTGGKITLKICTAAADGSPGTVLAQSALNNGQAAFCDANGKQTGSWGFYDYWPTSPGAAVVAGQKLCFFFDNTATDDGWVSMDTMIEYANVPTGLTPPQHAGIYFGDEIRTYGRYPYGSGPDARANMGGLFIVHYEDGINDGNPWYFAKSEGRKTAGGAKMVRQRFTVSDYSRIVSGLWFRCWWPDPNHVAPGPLLVRFMESTGTIIQDTTIPASQFVNTPNYAATDPYAPWTKIDFTAARQLVLGKTYFVQFSASSGAYEFAPQQLFSDDTCRNAPVGNWAQWSADSGTTWTDWGRTDQAGRYDRTWHLSCAFIVSG